jgi:hypothetical protein
MAPAHQSALDAQVSILCSCPLVVADDGQQITARLQPSANPLEQRCLLGQRHVDHRVEGHDRREAVRREVVLEDIEAEELRRGHQCAGAVYLNL